MPGLISVSEFVEESREDVNSPTTSTFVSRMSQCRQTVAALEEILDVDREGLTKLKKAVKAMHASGNGKNKEFFFCCFLNYFLGMYTHTCLVYEVEDLFFFSKQNGAPF